MIDVRMFTVGPVQENCFIVRRAGRARRALDRRPGRRGADSCSARSTSLGHRDRRGDPDHAHALRPHRRGGAGGARRPRRRCTARSWRRRCWPTSWTTSRGRASARSRATRPTTRSRGGETLELAGSDDRRRLHSGPQPRPRDLRDRRRTTRCSPATCCSRARSGGSTSRAATGRRCWPRSRALHERYPPRRRSTRATWASPRSGASAPPTRSCASSRSGEPSVIQAPRGTFDILPEAAPRRDGWSRRRPSSILGAAGYRRIETPTFEATELFARGVGEATDIVQKEMYTFDDGGGRSLTLRPRAPRRSAAPTSSTECASSRSR